MTTTNRIACGNLLVAKVGLVLMFHIHRFGSEQGHSRADRLSAAVARGAVEVTGISAGLHALVGLRGAEADEAAVIRRAAALGLEVTGLVEHRHVPADGEPGIVVGFGTPSEAEYPRALAALSRALSDRGAAGKPRTARPTERR